MTCNITGCVLSPCPMPQETQQGINSYRIAGSKRFSNTTAMFQTMLDSCITFPECTVQFYSTLTWTYCITIQFYSTLTRTYCITIQFYSTLTQTYCITIQFYSTLTWTYCITIQFYSTLTQHCWIELFHLMSSLWEYEGIGKPPPCWCRRLLWWNASSI